MPEPTLIVRNDESRDELLRSLVNAYGDVRESRSPRLELLVAPRGSGASQLLERFTRRVGPPVVMRARGLHGRAFGLIHELLDEVLPESSATPDDVVRLDSWVERRMRFFSLIRQRLQHSSGPRPNVILIDDLDQADLGSLDLLLYLLERRDVHDTTIDAPVLFIATATALTPELRALAQSQRTRTHRLHPFDLDELRAYLQRDDLVAHILHATGGLVERVDALLAGAHPPQLVLSALPVKARRVLAAAAILERPMALTVVSKVADVSPNREDVDALVSAELVTTRVRDGVMALTVPSRQVLETIRSNLTASDNRRLHSRAADALGSTSPEEAAHHAMLAGDRERAIELATKAIESMTIAHGPQQAARLLTSILDGMDSPPLRACATAAELLVAVGEFDQALPLARRSASATTDKRAKLTYAQALAGSRQFDAALEQLNSITPTNDEDQLDVRLQIGLSCCIRGSRQAA